MNKSQNDSSDSKRLAVVPDRESREVSGHDVRFAFDGTIASVCESTGISFEQMIEMMRWARESDPRIAHFLDAWGALDPSERQARTADAVRKQIGLKLPEMLKIVADVTCRIAVCQAQIIAAVSHPEVVEKTVERALTDEGIADRIALHKVMGFLPTPKGSQTTIGILQTAQTTAAVQSVPVPRPEQTIRRLSGRFNQASAVPPDVQAEFLKEGNE